MSVCAGPGNFGPWGALDFTQAPGTSAVRHDRIGNITGQSDIGSGANTRLKIRTDEISRLRAFKRADRMGNALRLQGHAIATAVPAVLPFRTGWGSIGSAVGFDRIPDIGINMINIPIRATMIAGILIAIKWSDP
jgi:hypothetical protein